MTTPEDSFLAEFRDLAESERSELARLEQLFSRLRHAETPSQAELDVDAIWRRVEQSLRAGTADHPEDPSTA